MKKALLILAFAFVVLGASAQSQKVKVTSAAEGDLPFSYIYVNNKIFGAADKNAQVIIPRAQLKDGDTISATHIGFNKGHIIYKGPKNDGYVINMTADDLEKITIYGRKETRQEFSEIEPKPQFMALPSDFSFRIVLDINGKEYLRGNFYGFGVGICGRENKVCLEVDDKYIPLLADEGQKNFIKEFITDIFLDVFKSTTGSIETDNLTIEKNAIKVRKTAEIGTTRTFSLFRFHHPNIPCFKTSEVFIDINTTSKMIISSRMDILYGFGRLKLTTSYSYGKQSFLIEDFYSKQDVRYPEVVEATYTMRDGTVYTIDIYDTRLTDNDNPRKFSNHNSVWAYDIELNYIGLEKGMLNAEKKGWPWEKWFENKE